MYVGLIVTATAPASELERCRRAAPPLAQATADSRAESRGSQPAKGETDSALEGGGFEESRSSPRERRCPGAGSRSTRRNSLPLASRRHRPRAPRRRRAPSSTAV